LTWGKGGRHVEASAAERLVHVLAEFGAVLEALEVDDTVDVITEISDQMLLEL